LGLPLGNITNNSSAQENRGFQVNPQTGEIYETTERNPKLARAERFALQATARGILGKDHRTAKCMGRKAPKQEIEILKSKQHGKAHYKGLYVCARLWTCPICAAKISERRRMELVGALASAKAQGLHVKLLTLTVPHGMGDDVNDLLAGIKKAWKATTSNRDGKSLRKLLGLKGTIRALEVTYGKNGFHPHLHVLLFLENEATNLCVESLFSPLWQKACTKAGLPRPSDMHGCRVDDGSKAAAYASKWGLESEMTKNHTKRGKAGGMTPWDFLRAVLEDGPDAAKYRALFKVYTDAFHGERQLHWSVGLKDLLEVTAASDEELAISDQEDSYTLARLVTPEWRAIMHARAQAAVLDVAEDRPEELPALIAGLYRRHRAYLERKRKAE
jgi:hypothetical protein